MKEYYSNKTILITGATGFVGKSILWQLLKEAGDVIDKVYVLIRPKRIPAGSPSQRILDEIINTPVGAFSRHCVHQVLMTTLGVSKTSQALWHEQRCVETKAHPDIL